MFLLKPFPFYVVQNVVLLFHAGCGNGPAFLYKGALSCKCGYYAKISSGILMTPNKNQNLQDTPDLTRELYKDLPPDLISMFERSYNWMLEKMNQVNLHGKIIAETYINAWFLCTITCRRFQQTAFTLSLINIRKPF